MNNIKINRAHKIRLCPNNIQANYFTRACGVARVTYNWGLKEWKRQYENGEKPSAYGLKKQFNDIKRIEFPFVTEVTKCAPEQAFANLGSAFTNFFREIKNGNKNSYPRFKKRGKNDSFGISNDKFRIDEDKIRIPKLGWVKMRESLRFPNDKILSVTVSKTAGEWFVSINTECEIEAPLPELHAVGVDVGIKELAVTSDNRVFKNSRPLKNAQKRERSLQKSVSRRVKGSNNRKKAVVRLQRQYYKIACIRNDSIHKMTTAIIKSCSHLGIESLNVSGMMKNRRLAQALSDAALGESLRQFKYKAKWNGVEITEAERFFPSSKMCSNCGSIKDKLELSERIYECKDCGAIIDRDLNAAINLENLIETADSAGIACRLGSSGLKEISDETTDWAGISQKSDLSDLIRRKE